MYVCMHVCVYYVCMRVCTPFGAPFGALFSFVFLAVFGHVQKLAAILVHVGYQKIIVRCRTRTTSCDVEAHRTIFVK